MPKRGPRVLPREALEHLDAVRAAVEEFNVSGAGRTEELLETAHREIRGAMLAVLRARVHGEPRETLELSAMPSRVLRRHRLEAGWTQADFSLAMTEMGFHWSRVTVAEVEAGTRKVSLDELLACSVLYGVPMVAFLLPQDNEWIALGGAPAVSPETGRALISGNESPQLAGGPEWEPALSVALAEPGERDWRPASDLWRNRRDLER